MANDRTKEMKQELGGSDPEEEEDLWCLRRREASDDEEDVDKSSEEGDVRSGEQRDVCGFDDELNGAGRAPEELEPEEEEGQEEGQNRNDFNAPVIPRIGTFYMHDDRFGSRMTSGGKKLREFKDERIWQHDKFEEMTMEEAKCEKFNVYTKGHMISYGHNQGHYGNQGRRNEVKANQFKPNDRYKSQGYSSKTIKGRGPVMYRPFWSSSYGDQPTVKKEYQKVLEMDSNTDSAMALSRASLVDSNSLDFKPKKMHYHASSSSTDIYATKKRDVYPRKIKGYLPGDSTRVLHSNADLQGRSVTDYRERNVCHAIRCTNLPLHSSLTRDTGESRQQKGQAVDGSLPELMSHLSLGYADQVDKFSPIGHQHAVHRTFSENAAYSHLQAYYEQFCSYSGFRSQSSLTAPPSSGYDLGVLESFASLRKLEMIYAGVGSVSGTARGYGRGSEFGETATPLFPTTQFEHQLVVGDLCELANHRTVARCLAQPEVGFGNFATTWQSFLADKIGCVGPKVTLAGENAFSLGHDCITSNEASAGKLGKPPHGNEVASDQYRKQRIKPQRYSKMNFKD